MRSARLTVGFVVTLVGTSQASAGPGLNVSGSAYEETAEARVPLAGVRVKLYRDGGDGRPDGRDDRLVSTTRTDAAGQFSLGPVPPGLAWLAMDSMTIASSRSVKAAAAGGELWAEQSWGPAGALCADGAGGTTQRHEPGPCVGGRRAEASDSAARLASAEHVAALTNAGGSLPQLDFGFSFAVVATTRDGDDDARSGRSVQGSLRQFLTNARALAGPDAMRFVPASKATQSAGAARYWRIDVATPLPPLDDDGTLVDGTAHALADNQVLDSNPGRVGAPTDVGLDRTPLVGPERAELEIAFGTGVEQGFVVREKATIRHVALFGAGVNVVALAPATLEEIVIGARADGSPVSAAGGVGVAALAAGSLELRHAYVAGQSRHGLLAESAAGTAHITAEHVEVARCGTEAADGNGISFRSSGSVLLHGFVHGNGASGAEDTGVELRGEGNRVEGSTLAENSRGVVVASGASGSLVAGNVVARNRGAGVAIDAGAGARNRVSRNSYAGNGTALAVGTAAGAGSEAGVAAACDAERALSAPAIDSAEVGSSGALRVAGRGCAGASVEVYATEPDAFRFLGAAPAADCGEFAALITGLAPGASVTALAVGPGGSSGFGPARAVTATEAPEASIDTPYGVVVVRLRPDLAPGQVRHFLDTAAAGGYDGTLFHRVVPGAIVVGGDPLSKDPARPERYGRGGLGMLRAEFSKRCFARGVLAAVRCPNNCDTAGDQFFVCLEDRVELNGQYTVFGDVVFGLDVVERLSRVPVDGDRPLARLPMRVTLVPAKAP